MNSAEFPCPQTRRQVRTAGASWDRVPAGMAWGHEFREVSGADAVRIWNFLHVVCSCSLRAQTEMARTVLTGRVVF